MGQTRGDVCYCFHFAIPAEALRATKHKSRFFDLFSGEAQVRCEPNPLRNARVYDFLQATTGQPSRLLGTSLYRLYDFRFAK